MMPLSLSFTNPAALWALPFILLLLIVPLLSRGPLPARGRQATRGPQGRRLTLRHGLAAPSRAWWSVALRGLIALALLLSLAGAQLVSVVNTLSVVYLLDLSDSVPAAERARGEEFIRQSVRNMPSGDRAAVVAFGQNALVERLASDERDLPRIASAPVATRTDIAAALQLGLALFPEASRKRLVILSDGVENVGQALAQAHLAAGRAVEISYVPLGLPSGEAEAYLDHLEAPGSVRLGQKFDLTAVVESAAAQRAVLQLFSNGALVKSVEADLQPGLTRLRIPLDATQPGFQRYRVDLVAPKDLRPQNNSAAGFTVVQGPPRVLLVEGKAGEAGQLADALRAAHVEPVVTAPERAPQDLANLSSFDAVFLVDTPAEALPDVTMKALPQYVRELGRGLVMVGGENSFGAGGYLRSPVEAALPVDMDVRDQEQEPNLALVLAVDKSGSMGRCHCDDPSLKPGEYAPVLSGLPKVDIAKEAILRTYGVLGRLDFMGVVAYDSDAHWPVPLQQLINEEALQKSVSGLQAAGQTNIYAGLNEAEAALENVNARVKHIILLTDGWSQSGQYDALVARMKEQGITLSVIAAGRGSAPYLQALAERGGGRYYPAENVQELPQVFLKETIQAVGRYIIEEPFYPVQTAATPILDGVGERGVPGLYGYNGSTAKATARVSLVSHQGDPLLAQWQYGLGRSVAWTSDLSGRWAAEWVKWDEFVRFVGQLASWVLPQPASQNLQTALALDGNTLALDVDALDNAGRPWNFLQMEATVIGPDLAPQRVALPQVAPGHYRATVPVNAEGTYMVQVVGGKPEANAGQAGAAMAVATSGFVVPYSPEYKNAMPEAGIALLRDLASATGGAQLASATGAWARTGRPARAAQPISALLLLAAALLFPLDVAVRRLRLAPRDWRAVGAWLRGHLPAFGRMAARARAHGGASGPHSGVAPAPPALGDLYAARSRARARSARGHSGAHPTDHVPHDPNEPRGHEKDQ